jgi:hypothetical protein
VWLHAFFVQGEEKPVRGRDGTGIPEAGAAVQEEQEGSANDGMKGEVPVALKLTESEVEGPGPGEFIYHVHNSSQNPLNNEQATLAGAHLPSSLHIGSSGTQSGRSKTVTSTRSLVSGSKTSELQGQQPQPESVSVPSSSMDQFYASEQQPAHLQRHIAAHTTETASVTLPNLTESAADASMDAKMTFLHYQLDQIGPEQDMLDGLQLLGNGPLQRLQGGGILRNNALGSSESKLPAT